MINIKEPVCQHKLPNSSEYQWQIDTMVRALWIKNPSWCSPVHVYHQEAGLMLQLKHVEVCECTSGTRMNATYPRSGSLNPQGPPGLLLWPHQCESCGQLAGGNPNHGELVPDAHAGQASLWTVVSHPWKGTMGLVTYPSSPGSPVLQYCITFLTFLLPVEGAGYSIDPSPASFTPPTLFLPRLLISIREGLGMRLNCV